jgi:quinol monooxygenase YgiN
MRSRAFFSVSTRSLMWASLSIALAANMSNRLLARYAEPLPGHGAGSSHKGYHGKGFDMLTITAIIRAKKGHEDTMRRALLQVAENVRSNEPNTISFFVSQDQANACVFTTYERFVDQAAMDAHNNSEVVARFFGIAKPILDGDVVLVTGTEVATKA